MARMIGAAQAGWCHIHHGPAGPDCPSTAWTKRQAKRREDRAWRREAAGV
jgi:hypothetical protein